MLASMLAPSPANSSGRISQLLPTVKCSNCNQPVPLSELGDHTCAPPPPVPTLPKPSVTPAAATALLPQRLQGRLPAVTNPPPQQRLNTPSTKANTPLGSFQPRSSPLSRSPDDGPSHMRTAPRPGADDFRSRTPSHSSSVSSPIHAPRPSFSSLRDGPPPSNSIPTNMNGERPSLPVNIQPPPGVRPPPNMQRPLNTQSPPNVQPPMHLQRPSYTQPPSSNFQTPTHIQRPSNGQPPNLQSPTNMQRPPNHQPPSPTQIQRPSYHPPPSPSHVQHPSNVQYPSGNLQFPVFNVETPPPMIQYSPRALDNIDTKTGGVAGMAGIGRRGFAAAARAAMFVASPGPQPQIRRANPPPQFLDLDAAARSSTTPPLSAGSGYSSHSPGPLSPSPQADYSQTTKASRTPSPSSQYLSAAHASPGAKPNVADAPLNSISTSPTSVRLPFFEKYKNTVSKPSVDITPTDLTTRPVSTVTRSSVSSYGETPPTRTRKLSIDPTAPPLNNLTTPTSPSSGSELGLAYADDTDEDVLSEPRSSLKARVKPPPALQLSSSLLRGNTSSSGSHVRFPSTSDGDDNFPIRTPTNKQYIRGESSSPVSRAFDASQTSPSSGPGVGMRLGRSTSESSSSSGSRSTYSRTTSSGLLRHDTGALERALDTLLEDTSQNTDAIRELGLSKSKSLRKQPSVSSSSRSGSVKGLEYRKPSLDGINMRGLDSAAIRAGLASRKASMDSVNEGQSMMSPGSKTQRSNTIQGTGPQSPESRAPKLPTRSRTSPAMDRDKLLNPESARMRKDKVKIPKVCLRCTATIDDGRWVKVDNGGILCEKCWKNMYLPKCRRCSLPIEKQAVSSSDGQLKGKYHKECFNCHVCHKPFPDKSFYVYDGKPLCAYHYHEANESLCAAARCGQPIEGPCAVSHAGDRYHPEHMTCEYPGYPECQETLKEYWEIDGRMLCERHASGTGSDDEDDDNWVQSSRALKRVTRFIDLAGAGTGGVPGEVEGSDLR